MIEFINQNNSNNLILFIHGFTGNKATWVNLAEKSFPEMLLNFENIKKNFAMAYYNYESNLFNLNTMQEMNYFLRKLTKINKLERKKNLDAIGISKNLSSSIKYLCQEYENIIIIAHSFGGLIAKSYILDELEETKECRVKMFMSLAVPHDGSTLAKLAKVFLKRNSQVSDLEPLSNTIKNLNNRWIRQKVLPKTIYFSAQADGVVSETSSISYETVKPDVVWCDNEDHLSIAKPETEDSIVFKAVKILLEQYLVNECEKNKCELCIDKAEVNSYSDTNKEHKILYLYSYLAENGFEHISNRQLIERLKDKYSLVLKYAIFDDEEMDKLKDSSLERQVIASSEFLEGFDVLIIENRLGVIKSNEMTDRLRATILNKFIDAGGIVIFLSKEQIYGYTMDIYNEFLEKAGLPLYKKPNSNNEFPDFTYLKDDRIPKDMILGYDSKKSLRNGYCYNININKEYLEYINSAMIPVFEEISNIVVEGSIQISGEYKSLLAGNKTTRMLCKDMYWDGDLYHIFAGYNDLKKGVGVLITGSICCDVIVNSYETDSIELLLNLLRHLLKMQYERKSFL